MRIAMHLKGPRYEYASAPSLGSRNLEVNPQGLAVAFTALGAALQRRAVDWPFCFGDAPGWADLHRVPQMRNTRRFGCDVSGYPLLCGVDARCVQLEPFRLARPEMQPDYAGG